ncbi:dienelactone hydrolase [Paenibacillus phyllosphaerae]|uniref:Dienelactone hydrolase n=1 Tax=Paenibacillus phyllosphaerae TaxID=274593 RepID=A0A7W5FM84_9BACL|nr:alpha/beta hydrolase [Paenibacillus phyllosphaerae]MBB3109812.1 dienelactone hydrolase [Paenibacillus phyllosphaerae]
MELPLDNPMPMPDPAPRPKQWLRAIGRWLIYRFIATFARDTLFWRLSVIGVWVVYMISLLLTVLGTPTGLGVAIDCLIAAFLGTVVMGTACSIIAFLFSMMYVPLPRFFAGSLLYTGFIVYVILYHADMGNYVSVVSSVIVAVAGAIAGIILAILLHPRIGGKSKLAFATVLVLAGVSSIAWPPANTPAEPALAPGEVLDVPIIEAGNPALAGSYPVRAFTYGSGVDRHRSEYGEAVGLITPSVDASAYITKWSRIREWFWGFDETALPVNGRMWMPEGEGPFPVVLIVHGNHLMEQFSDGGYAYLGELLASRGFVTVSVDENFLNYSVWGNIPNQDFKVRAWMLLKHLQQLANFNQLPGNPMSGKLDMNRVALMGHSRGGQAAPMAADWTRWFKSDQTLAGLEDIHVQAVVAIAPTDKQIDKTSARLKDIYYLTLQGAQDGDVNDFYGERQYIRTSFSNTAAGNERFKASLYIGEANHSRFNTDWGTMDDSLPGGLFLRHAGMMPADDQREVAKVYIAAFLETALHGKSDYEPLFEDYRTAGSWLPEATYFNQYEKGAFLPLATFDEDRDKTVQQDGSTAEVDGLQWSEEEAIDRQRHNRGTRGVVLKWNEGRGGSYTIELSESFRRRLSGASPETVLQFSMSDLERDLREKEQTIPPLDVQVDVTLQDGSSITQPLQAFMPVVEPVQSQFTIASWMEKRIKDGKYKESTEPVLQTYRLPLKVYDFGGQPTDASEITAITFRFQGGPGKVMLDNIGFDNLE